MNKEEVKVSIVNVSFPDPNTTQDKNSLDFGLRIGQAIQNEWFRRDGSSCRYYNQVAEFNRLRLYARGEQPIGKYKSQIAHDGDLTFMNINWDIVPIIPKFVDIVVNGMTDREYKICARAQDIMSAEQKNIFQDMVEADMLSRDTLSFIKNNLGVDAFNVPEDELPETSEELSLYMQLKYKPSIELAQEVAIDTVMKNNDFATIQEQLDKDFTEIGVAFARHYLIADKGVGLEYCDPEKMVWSETKKPDFTDCYYFGEVKKVHYTELLKINPYMTEHELNECKEHGSAWNDYYGGADKSIDMAFAKDSVTLLYFSYLTDVTTVYKKKYLETGGVRMIKKDMSFNPEPNDLFERVDVTEEVWFEGCMVLGSNKILDWKRSSNVPVENNTSKKPIAPFIGYAPRMHKGRIDSLVRRMIPFADQIQLVHIKLQQVQSRIVPDGVFIDADGINEVDLGTGAAYNPEDALKLYFQTGSVIGRSYTGEGEFNNARVPIQELATGAGQNKIGSLINSYNYYLNMIRDVTGLNEARDGSTPHPDALVGIQKLAALNSNVATRHILDGRLNLVRRLATACSLRIADILKYQSFADAFAMQIGKNNIAILNDIKDIPLRSFGIFIEMAPDAEEKDNLEKNMQIALSRDQIDIEDVIDIRNIKNIKLANELLKMKKKRRLLEKQRREDQVAQQQAEYNQQNQQAAAQAKAYQIEMESTYKAKIKETEIALEIEKMKIEAELKLQLMDREFQYNIQLATMNEQALQDREDKKEKAKDDRVNLQASRQSDMIEQRQKGLPPKNFESTEDSLDGFDLESFGPR